MAAPYNAKNFICFFKFNIFFEKQLITYIKIKKLKRALSFKKLPLGEASFFKKKNTNS